MNKAVKWFLGGVLVLALAIGGGVLWFLNGTPDPQERASLDNIPTGDDTGDDSPDGCWSLVPADPSNPELAEKLYGGFRIDVTVAGQTRELTSRTPDVTGYDVIADGAFQPARIDTNIKTLTSTDPGIDLIVGQTIKSKAFPNAVLEVLGSTPVPGGIEQDTEFTVDLPVEFTIGGATRAYTLTMVGKWTGGSLIVTGNLPIKLKDHDLTLPPIPGVSVGDIATIEFQLLHEKAEDPAVCPATPPAVES